MMWNKDVNVDKYLYVRTNANLLRFLGLVGVVCTISMAYGYYQFFNLSNIYIILFGGIVAVFIWNKFVRYFIQIFYPKFDIEKHEKFVYEFWETYQVPSVDIFLPWAGEDLDMHEEVLKGVAKIDYENYQVYMLDDKGSDEHKALAEKYGFNYLSRPNKGEHKKSGNLEYGYAHSNGQFVFILDADFIPSRNSLKDAIPYIFTDEKIGILQSPQYLEQHDDVHKRSKVEFGGGNIVEDFYKISQTCRDVFKAAMCVGTSAIYRRSAIDCLDGTPKVHASEDLATGLLVTEHGYYVKYLPLVLSIGKSPESFEGYFKQHHRWCSGNLVFAKYWPRARMNPVARLIYLGNPAYYLSEALGIIFSFHFLALIYFHGDSLSLMHSLYFLPYVVFSRFIMPLTKSKKSKTGTRLAALSNSYTYLYTYLFLIFSGAPTWHPTGVKTSKLHRDFVNSINMGTFISTVYVLLFIVVILSKPEVLGNYNTYLILGWSIYSVIWHTYFLFTVSKFILGHLIIEVEGVPAKAWHYAKAHIVLILTSILTSSILFNSAIVMQNPDTITAKAVAQLIQAEVDPIAIETPVAEERVVIAEVLAAEAVREEYIYYVESGDTPDSIAQRAVLEYISENNVEATDSQIYKIAKYIIEEMNLKGVIYPEEQIIIKRDLIIEATLSVLGV